MSIKVAILLGGKGKRLNLKDIPKPMVPFLGKPLLEHLVIKLVAQGFKDLVFLTGHMHSVIEKYFQNGKSFGANIKYSQEIDPLGTARATLKASTLLGDEFLLLYGDVVIEFDINRFVRKAIENGGHGTLVVHPNDHPFDSDLVVCDSVTSKITKFLNKPHSNEVKARNLVNAGLYYLKKEIFSSIPDKNLQYDWGRDIFPLAVKKNYNLYAYRSAEYIKDIGTPERLKNSEQLYRSNKIHLKSMVFKQKAIFLDRDGVINREINGVSRPNDLILIPGIAKTIREINNSEFLVICITNQPGIAKGFINFEELNLVHIELDRLLQNEGAYLDDLFFCPHHPDKGFKGEVLSLKKICNCRKPSPGMIFEAAKKYNIDLSNSYFVGDRMSDLVAAKSAGVRSILVHRNGEVCLQNDDIDLSYADQIFRNMSIAWENIINS